MPAGDYDYVRSGRVRRSNGTEANEADGINADGSKNVSVIGSKYQETGLTVEGLAMAAGATVSGSWIDNLQWVRNIVALTQSDQQYDLQIFVRDSTGANAAYSPITNSGATGAGWKISQLVGANGLLGYSAQFRIKNSGAAANTYARARIQLLGQ